MSHFHCTFFLALDVQLLAAKLDAAKTKPAVFTSLCKVPIIIRNEISVAIYGTKCLPKYL